VAGFKKRPVKEMFSALQRQSPRAIVRAMPPMTGGAIFGIRSMLATSGRIDAPYAPPFAEQSAPNAVLPLKDGGPLRV